MQLDIQMLLDSFEAPAVFYRENTVRYFNKSAKLLFPELKAGKGMPEGFDAPEFPFRAEANRTERGTLYLFRPRLEEKNGDDLAEVSRQLRSCLSVLALAAQELGLCLENRDEKSDRLLQSVSQSLFRLRRLADHSDLLRQMETREPGVYRERTLDLAELCRGVGEYAAELAGQAGIRFRLECREKMMVTRGDGDLLRRMILNLLSNAMKAAGEGGEVGLRLEKKEERAILTVWDTGSGMQAERLAAVFRPQRRHRIARPEEGAGMGLRLVRETVVLHAGVVLAEARPEGGVRMTVSLPLRAPRSGSLGSKEAWGEDGFDLVLVELSDALPASVYSAEHIDE